MRQLKIFVVVLALQTSFAGTTFAEIRPAAISEGIQISASLPLVVIEGNVYWGSFVSALHQSESGLAMGIESGFFIGKNNPATVWTLPFLATGLYRFGIPGGSLRPFGGLGMGVAITHTSGGVLSTTISGTPTTFTQQPGTEAEFETMIHLGVEFGEDFRYFGDFRIGIVDGATLFGPTVGLHF